MSVPSGVEYPGSSGVGMRPTIAPGASVAGPVKGLATKYANKGQQYAAGKAGSGAAYLVGKMGGGKKAKRAAAKVGRFVANKAIGKVRKVLGFKKGGKVKRRYASGGRVRRSP